MSVFNLLRVVAACVALTACGGGNKPDDRSLKVVSYNIRYSNDHDGQNRWDVRKGATLEMLRREDPDLVGMQEVLSDQFDFLNNNAAGYGIAGVGRDDGERDGEMMAVLYKKARFGKLDEGHFWLSETPDEASRGWDGACNRMVTWLKLSDKATGKEIYFFNTHLDHEGQAARTEGSNLIAANIEAITAGEPFILTGDFNAQPEDEVLRGLNDNFASARANAPVADSKDTFNGFGVEQGGGVIDHIYYRGFNPTLFRTLDGDYGATYISDHYPVEAVFEYIP